MASNLKNRINRISEKTNPKRFQTIDDIIFLVHGGNKEDLTDEDRRRIEETKDLPLHPDLEKAFNRLQAKREQTETNAGNPR